MADQQASGLARLEPDKMTSEDLSAQFGLDVERKWATSVQVFKTEEHALFVFREVVQFQGPDSESPELHLRASLQRNVTSVVMPLGVAVELTKVLNGLFGDANPEG